MCMHTVDVAARRPPSFTCSPELPQQDRLVDQSQPMARRETLGLARRTCIACDVGLYTAGQLNRPPAIAVQQSLKIQAKLAWLCCVMISSWGPVQ